VKAGRLLRALEKLGFTTARTAGSHRFLKHSDGRTMLFSFHARETVGPRMLSRILKDAGVTIEDLREEL
jgi:predicted RNA binding protein YcfA (HicA-like mRNA interferase family)